MENLAASMPGASLIEVALQKMRSSIIRCELAPGAKLKMDLLTKTYGLSSSPIREALNRLAQEGIVCASENRGFRVAPISVRDFDEISRIRILLESEALSDAILYGDDTWEGDMLAAFHRLSVVEKRLGTGPVALDDEWSERHRAFHLSMFAACPSPLILGMIESLFDRAERYRRYSAQHRQGERHKSNEHEVLLNAVLARDKTLALGLLRQHIEHTRDSVHAALEREQAQLQ